MTDRQPRLLSFSEIQTALTCWARWDFAYGGRLAGSTLKPKMLAPVLSDGRAWGAAVAAYHSHSGELLASFIAHGELRASLDRDEEEMRKFGIEPAPGARVETENRLGAMLDHYIATTDPLPNLSRLEEEIVVAIPSRGGQRSSTRYRFLCYLDGWTDDNGQQWLVEFKLRGQLQPVKLIEKAPQLRWYSWALAKQGGPMPVGVLLDERLNEVPKPARLLKGRVTKADPNPPPTPSHAKDQVTTPERYRDACLEFGVEPKSDVMDALGARVWQQRVPLIFRRGELLDAGTELVSAAKLIRDLDSGELMPIRNAQKQLCSGCKFRDICSNPTDELFVDTQFHRSVPKRLRDPKELTRT